MVEAQSLHLVWYKRDLRVKDHAALCAAVESGSPVVALYIVEPSFVTAPDFAPSHWTFLRESLIDLRASLRAIGGVLVVRIGEAVAVLSALHTEHPIAAIHAHEETGNWLSYMRDRAVRQWARAESIPLYEYPQTGAVRALVDRDRWAGIRAERMRAPIRDIPTRVLSQDVAIDPGAIPSQADIGLLPDPRQDQQRGGEAAARRVLLDFLTQRGIGYAYRLANPTESARTCARISLI